MKKTILFVSILISFIIFSCNRENFITDEKAKLDFSNDTVMFDTVFTTIGSTTKMLLVYNNNDGPIKISSIKLAGEKNSCYRLNIDGQATNELKDYELAANDSLFIFVEVTVNPNRDEMIEQDSIIFETNGNYQDIDLVAFGQDVNLFNGEVIKSQTWTNTKPYLIYNSVLLDTLEVLQIEAGTKIYNHRNSTFYVKGSLIVNGTLEEPVVFQGDRLENYYKDWPGQWNGIRFLYGSNNNLINYAEIKGGVIGITIDTLFTPNEPNLRLFNSKIWHHSIAGIYAKATYLISANSIFADCGIYSVACLYGGNYVFYDCTIDNHWNYGGRNTPALVLNNYITDENDNDFFWGNLSATFVNCIVSGNLKNEFYPDAFDIEGGMSFAFKNCYAIVDTGLYRIYKDLFVDCVVNDTTMKYKSLEKFDFNLDTLSPIKDKAFVDIINVNFDLLHIDIEGKDRFADGKPDIGALERVE